MLSIWNDLKCCCLVKHSHSLNSLPNNKILDCSKFKAFEDNKINVIEKLKFVFRYVENIVGQKENAGYQDFLLFLQCL